MLDNDFTSLTQRLFHKVALGTPHLHHFVCFLSSDLLLLCAFVSQFQLLLSHLTKGNFSMLRPGSYSFNVVNKLSRFVLQSINIATLGAKFDSKHFYLFIQLLVGFYETNVFSGQISLTIDQVLKLFTLLDWARIWIDRRPIDGLRINWNS